jgi:DNA modification methylase
MNQKYNGFLIDKKDSISTKDNSHMFFEGDNKNAMLALLSTHKDKIKAIFLQPPYDTKQELIHTNSHPNYLDMMEDRLHICRDLMRDDGIILINIFTYDLYNLKIVCDRVFGPENHAGEIIINVHRTTKLKYFFNQHEYILVYTKDKNKNSGIWLNKDNKQFSSVQISDQKIVQKRIDQLFGAEIWEGPFDEILLTDILNGIGVTGEDIILDPFAGSGTTFHSVLKLNENNLSNCLCISIQIPVDLIERQKFIEEKFRPRLDNAIAYLKKNNKPIDITEITKLRMKIVMQAHNTDNKGLIIYKSIINGAYHYNRDAHETCGGAH